jgi:hypothetical protein
VHDGGCMAAAATIMQPPSPAAVAPLPRRGRRQARPPCRATSSECFWRAWLGSLGPRLPAPPAPVALALLLLLLLLLLMLALLLLLLLRTVSMATK